MENKCILIIDDTEQKVNIKSLNVSLRNYCSLDVISVKTTDKELKEDSSERLDIDKLKKRLETEIQGKSINFVFTDFNLSEENINGLTVVSILKDIRKNLKIVMYSGNISTVIKSAVKIKDFDNVNEDQLVDAVKKLMEYGIIDYIPRDNYVEKAIRLIKSSGEPTAQDYFIEQLRFHSDMEFKSCYSKLSGKNFGEIADMIEKGSDKRTDVWTQELIEQSIAYLVKINE